MTPRGDGPFQIAEKINNNAYKLDLPSEYGSISSTFKVADLSLFDVGDDYGVDNAVSDSRTNPFEGGGNDAIPVEAIPAETPGPFVPLPPVGPMTRARASKLQDRLSSLIHKELERGGAVEKVVFEDREPRTITLLTIGRDLDVCPDLSRCY